MDILPNLGMTKAHLQIQSSPLYESPLKKGVQRLLLPKLRDRPVREGELLEDYNFLNLLGFRSCFVYLKVFL